jgi:hypothetical protein
MLCGPLKVHPTLTSLDLRDTMPIGPETVLSISPGIRLSDEQKVHRTRFFLLAEMMQQNAVLQTITLFADEKDEQIYTQDIRPYLETNLYRPWVLAVKKANVQIRRAVLGVELQTEAVRNDSNLLWMFLSGNVDVVLQSTEDE